MEATIKEICSYVVIMNWPVVESATWPILCWRTIISDLAEPVTVEGSFSQLTLTSLDSSHNLKAAWLVPTRCFGTLTERCSFLFLFLDMNCVHFFLNFLTYSTSSILIPLVRTEISSSGYASSLKFLTKISAKFLLALCTPAVLIVYSIPSHHTQVAHEMTWICRPCFLPYVPVVHHRRLDWLNISWCEAQNPK